MHSDQWVWSAGPRLKITAKQKSWLRGFLSLESGVPSHETLRRLFCILDFEKFQGVLIEWAQEVKKSLGLEEDPRG